VFSLGLSLGFIL